MKKSEELSPRKERMINLKKKIRKRKILRKKSQEREDRLRKIVGKNKIRELIKKR